MGRVRGGGVDCHRNYPSLSLHMCSPRLSEGRAALAQVAGVEKPLAHLGVTGCFLYRIPVAKNLLCGLRASGS